MINAPSLSAYRLVCVFLGLSTACLAGVDMAIFNEYKLQRKPLEDTSAIYAIGILWTFAEIVVAGLLLESGPKPIALYGCLLLASIRTAQYFVQSQYRFAWSNEYGWGSWRHTGNTFTLLGFIVLSALTVYTILQAPTRVS